MYTVSATRRYCIYNIYICFIFNSADSTDTMLILCSMEELTLNKLFFPSGQPPV